MKELAENHEMCEKMAHDAKEYIENILGMKHVTEVMEKRVREIINVKNG